jgi:hypothetical protein
VQKKPLRGKLQLSSAISYFILSNSLLTGSHARVNRAKAGDSRIAPTKTPNAADQHLSADHGGVIAAASWLNMRTLSLNPARTNMTRGQFVAYPLPPVNADADKAH